MKAPKWHSFRGKSPCALQRFLFYVILFNFKPFENITRSRTPFRGPLLTTQKIIKRQGWWKVCFILDAGNWWGEGGGWVDSCSKANSLSQWASTFTGEWRGNMRSQPWVILKLVSGTLTSVILIILSIMSLQFQGPLVPISLRPVLRTVEAYVMATVWSCS